MYLSIHYLYTTHTPIKLSSVNTPLIMILMSIHSKRKRQEIIKMKLFMFIGNSFKNEVNEAIRWDEKIKFNWWKANLNNDKWLINIFQVYIYTVVSHSIFISLSLTRRSSIKKRMRSILDKEKNEIKNMRFRDEKKII